LQLVHSDLPPKVILDSYSVFIMGERLSWQTNRGVLQFVYNEACSSFYEVRAKSGKFDLHTGNKKFDLHTGNMKFDLHTGNMKFNRQNGKWISSLYE
jgi:hypothetical protein